MINVNNEYQGAMSTRSNEALVGSGDFREKNLRRTKMPFWLRGRCSIQIIYVAVL